MLHYLVGIGSVPNVALAAATPPNKARILIGSGSIVRIRLRMRLEIVPFRLPTTTTSASLCPHTPRRRQVHSTFDIAAFTHHHCVGLPQALIAKLEHDDISESI